jgi:hypothetical protein
MTSILKVDTLQDASGTGTPYIKGAVLQVQYTQYTSRTSVNLSANTSTPLSILTVDITPKSTSSIIKLDTHIFHEWGGSNDVQDTVWFFYRDTTKLAFAQDGNRNCGISTSRINYGGAIDADSTPEVAYYSYFDSPSTTSQITYKVGVLNNSTSTVYINQTVSNTDTNEYERGLSFISATEIGG